MNIVHFVYDYLPISETFIYNDITSIKKHNISVLSAKTRNMHLFPFKQIHSIDRLGIPAKYSEFARFKLFDSSAFFKKTILGTKAKLIHAHFGHIGAKLLKIKSTTKIPMITGFYGADIPILRNSGKAERLFSAGEAFIALSDDMKMDLMSIGCHEEKIRVRDVGIDISKFRFEARKPNGNLRFLCVARMVEKKGLPYLIQSMKKIAAALPEATLDIIGRANARRTRDPCKASWARKQREASWVGPIWRSDKALLPVPYIRASQRNRPSRRKRRILHRHQGSHVFG